MKRYLISATCLAILVGLWASIQGQTKPQAKTLAPVPAAMPHLAFRERTLANGLHVLSVVDKSTPRVAINVWYHVGSKDDPDQRSGFAHLFEHIMFKSTKNMKAEMMDRL